MKQNKKIRALGVSMIGIHEKAESLGFEVDMVAEVCGDVRLLVELIKGDEQHQARIEFLDDSIDFKGCAHADAIIDPILTGLTEIRKSIH